MTLFTCCFVRFQAVSNKSGLPQTDGRDATPSVLYTKVDARCDKLATAVSHTKLTTLATVGMPWAN